MAQIGTIRLQTQNSGTVSVPVYNLSDFGSSVHDMVRVDTPSGVGAIPFVATSDASFPYLRLQTQNNGVLAAHNEATLGPALYDDFESGITKWTHYGNGSGGISQSSSYAYNGTYSLEVYVTWTGYADVAVSDKTFGMSSKTQLYTYINTEGGDTTNYAGIGLGPSGNYDNDIAALFTPGGDDFKLHNRSTGESVTKSVNPAARTWYELFVEIDPSNNTLYGELRDTSGNVMVSNTLSSTENFSARSNQAIHCIQTTDSGKNWEAYFDDVRYSRP